MQNFIELSAPVDELTCIQRKKIPTKTIRSVAATRTVSKNKGTHLVAFSFVLPLCVR